MSILDDSPQSTPTIPERAADKLIKQTRQTFDLMVKSFNNGSNTFWNNLTASPTEIAQALGTDAREVFQLHYALGQLIGSVKPESIQQGLSIIGQFTMNEDGTVTIVPTASGV